MKVFPCHVATKAPYTSRGFLSATDDPRVIDRWAWHYPGCLWGFPIPPDVFVVDKDPRHGGDVVLERLEAEHGRLPSTRTTRTRSGGDHTWLGAGGAEIRQTAGLLGPGLDTRTHGRGYVIVPPSAGYSWLSEGPIAPAPAWLVDMLRPVATPVRAITVPSGRRAGYGEAALRDECQQVAAIPVGAGLRNHGLFVAACRLGELVGAGVLDENRAIEALTAASTLPEREARSTARSGLNRGRLQPRQVAS